MLTNTKDLNDCKMRETVLLYCNDIVKIVEHLFRITHDCKNDELE